MGRTPTTVTRATLLFLVVLFEGEGNVLDSLPTHSAAAKKTATTLLGSDDAAKPRSKMLDLRRPFSNLCAGNSMTAYSVPRLRGGGKRTLGEAGVKLDKQKTRRGGKQTDAVPMQESKRREERNQVENRPPVESADVQPASSRERSEVFEHPSVLTIFDRQLNTPGKSLVPLEPKKPKEPQGLDRIKHGLNGLIPGPSKDLLARLEADGEPGRWNLTEAEAGPWHAYSELLLMGHETFKYFRNGRHTGERMDRQTMEKWMRITNIHAPDMVGVPEIFKDVHARREGTLDFSFIKDRPACALDDVLKMTKFRHPDGHDASLWKDGLVPVEEEEEAGLVKKMEEAGGMGERRRAKGDMTELEEHHRGAEHKDENLETGGEEGIKLARRRALTAVMEGVEALQKEFKGCWSTTERYVAPKAHPQRVVLGLLKSEMVAKSGGMLAGEEVASALRAQNKAMAAWQPKDWEAHHVPAAVVAKARQVGFYLGCTDRWMLGEGLEVAKRQSEHFGYVDHHMDVEGLGRITTGTDILFRERYIE